MVDEHRDVERSAMTLRCPRASCEGGVAVRLVGLPRQGALTVLVAGRCAHDHALTERERAFLERLAFWEDSVARR